MLAAMLPRRLTADEARVLGTLMEKARTVPDTYPLSLNLIVAGANQKTSRDPVMQLSEAQAQTALGGLAELGLVSSVAGGRVARWQHHTQRALGVPEQSAVLLGLLMLRGAQTAGELRLNAERWYRFADISSVEGFLHELAERAADKGGPLVLRLPRAPGAREDRWAHVLCGAPAGANADGASETIAAHAALAGAHGVFHAQSTDGALARIAALEADVAALSATVDRLLAELGLSPAGRPAPPALATTSSD